MEDRQNVLGFTEAQLGFFLVLLFVVAWAALTQTKPAVPNSERASVTADSLDRLLEQVRVLTARSDSLQHLADSLESPIWPSCRTRGHVSQPLLTIVAVGEGRFRLGSDTITLRDVEELTKEARANAFTVRCRHEIRFGYRQDLLSRETESARQAIGALGLRILPGPIVMR